MFLINFLVGGMHGLLTHCEVIRVSIKEGIEKSGQKMEHFDGGGGVIVRGPEEMVRVMSR